MFFNIVYFLHSPFLLHTCSVLLPHCSFTALSPNLPLSWFPYAFSPWQLAQAPAFTMTSMGTTCSAFPPVTKNGVLFLSEANPFSPRFYLLSPNEGHSSRNYLFPSTSSILHLLIEPFHRTTCSYFSLFSLPPFLWFPLQQYALRLL